MNLMTKLQRIPFCANREIWSTGKEHPILVMEDGPRARMRTREQWESDEGETQLGPDQRIEIPIGMLKPPAWWQAHVRALNEPIRVELPILQLMDALENYAEWHGREYSSGVGEDGVLGDHWASIARGLLGLLNGERGRLDAGAIDSWVRRLAVKHGYTEEL